MREKEREKERRNSRCKTGDYNMSHCVPPRWVVAWVALKVVLKATRMS